MPSSATQKKINEREVNAWLKKWYPLLLVDQAKIEFDNAVRTTANPTSELEIDLIGRQFDDQRQQQWLTLKQRALIDGQQTEFARQALVYLICAASRGPAADSFAYWLAAESAHTLNYIASSEPFSRQLFDQIGNLLSSPHPARTGCHATVLQALNELTVSNPDSAQASGELLLTALKASLARTTPCPAEEEAYLISLIGQLRCQRYRPAQATLHAISDHHALDKVRAAASDALNDLSVTTVKAVYDETTPDAFSSMEGRAGRLSDALTKQYAGPTIVQELFSNCKGCPLTGAEDPRLASIFSLTSHAEPTVQMAASWVIAASPDIPTQMKEPLLKTLVEFAEGSDNPLLARQAEEVLAALSNDAQSHSLAGIIESARLAVRLRSAREHSGS
jgi:hypothetical protein